jgi:hypothetical protein
LCGTKTHSVLLLTKRSGYLSPLCALPKQRLTKVAVLLSGSKILPKRLLTKTGSGLCTKLLGSTVCLVGCELLRLLLLCYT